MNQPEAYISYYVFNYGKIRYNQGMSRYSIIYSMIIQCSIYVLDYKILFEN